MKFAYMFSALAVAATLTACANHHSNNSSTQAAAPDPYGIATLSVAQQQPSVTGTINIRQRIALPPDAVLTVTLSDASLADAPARVLSQKAVRTEGKQAPFNFALATPPDGGFFLPSINPAIMLEIDMAAAGDLHTLGQQRLTLPL